MTESAAVVNNQAESRYEVKEDDALATLEYEFEPGGRLVLTHTEVPSSLEGRGIAARLARAGLDDARSHGWVVVPQCAYVASYIKRHPEYEDLLPK